MSKCDHTVNLTTYLEQPVCWNNTFVKAIREIYLFSLTKYFPLVLNIIHSAFIERENAHSFISWKESNMQISSLVYWLLAQVINIHRQARRAEGWRLRSSTVVTATLPFSGCSDC